MRTLGARAKISLSSFGDVQFSASLVMFEPRLRPRGSGPAACILCGLRSQPWQIEGATQV